MIRMLLVGYCYSIGIVRLNGLEEEEGCP